MIIESLLVIALMEATDLAPLPPLEQPSPPILTCVIDGEGQLNCYPVDDSGKEYH